MAKIYGSIDELIGKTPILRLKNIEKRLDIGRFIFYYRRVRARGYYACDTAMNREIAPRGGNFRGVCPIIGRLRRICTLRRSLRHDQLPAGVCIQPVFFVSRNDTHG